MPKKIMPRISHLKTNASSVGFLKRINIDIDKINLLINTYNQAENQGTSITLLSEINKIRLHIQNDYSSYDMNQTIGFNKIIHEQLFSALKMACYDNQLTIYELSHLNETQSSAKNPQDMFSEIIENMSPDKVSLLIGLLEKPNVTFFGFKRNLNTDLNMLYSAHEKTTKEAREFDAFIQNNCIQYLAGKNSKIFKVSPRNEGNPFVVKIENRMGSPKKIENDLKTKLSCQGDVFIPSSGNRQGCTLLEGSSVTRNIIVNPFYRVGDLQSLAHQPLSEPMRAFKAIQIYKRMAIILNKIEEEYCFFPDMKNTNWIIDDNQHLLIGDTKSFRYTLIDHRYTSKQALDRNKWGKLFLSSTYMNPPEYKVNVDLVKSHQVHAYMLGKNIYQFLTCCSPKYLEQHIDGKSYNMGNSIFKTTYGEKLSQLIRGLIKKNPEKRIDIEQILSQFRVIKKELFNDQILTFKNTLYRIENNNTSDPLLIEYIQHFKNQTFIKENLEALIKLNEYLTNIQRISDMISKLINRLNDHGEHKKATTLENYFYKIPPEERLSIFSSQREEAKQFRASLAEHRYFFRQPITYKDPEKTIIDEYWASHSFVIFKKAVTKLNVTQNNDHCFDK